MRDERVMAGALPGIMRALDTRTELKRRGRWLFALRGIAAVGIREIALAAGQRNVSAVLYHFGGKDDLLRELLVDGAVAIDVERQTILDRAEAQGGVAMGDVVQALVAPSLHLHADPGRADTYHRFLANVMGERRELFEATIVGHHAVGYERCVAHVRRLLPHVAAAEVNRRLVFVMLSLQALFAAREAALDAFEGRSHPFWDRDDVTRGIGATIEAILLQGDTAHPGDVS